MLSVKQAFDDRVDEINLFYKLLDDIIKKEGQLIFPNEVDRRENLDIKLISILKSSATLQLYNLIESTITNSLKFVHDTFTREEILYENLSDEIQKIWIRFHYDYFKVTSNEKDVLHNLKVLVDTWAHNSVPIRLPFTEYIKYNTGSNFSGNLDAKEIRKISEKYGIDFDEKCDEIRRVRDKRNKLAHGELSFEEMGRSDTIEYMTNLKDKTIAFLNLFLDSVDNYLSDSKYRKD